MKKALSLVLALGMAASLLAGCGGATSSSAPASEAPSASEPEPSPSAEPTPEPTPSEAPAAGERWRCTICGYIYEGALPADFVCPLCGVGAENFERID